MGCKFKNNKKSRFCFTTKKCYEEIEYRLEKEEDDTIKNMPDGQKKLNLKTILIVVCIVSIIIIR